MRNAKQILKADPKLRTKMQKHVTHVPLEDDDIKTYISEERKTDEADVTRFTSNSDTYNVWEDEYDDVDRDYLK